jgi:prophage DNA circulation protein
VSWRDQLRPASFKGAEFETESLEAEFGRAGVVQEPVASDGAFFDDLRKKARRLQVSAFIIGGGDYAKKRDALIDAVESEGAGTLVHPTFGSRRVQCVECALSETVEAGREARFRLAFVEVGEQPFPVADLDRPALAKRRSESALAEVSDFFEDAWDSVAGVDYVVERGVARVESTVDDLQSIVDKASAALANVATISDRLDSLRDSISTLASSPGDLASEVVDVLETIGSRDPLVEFARAIVPVAVSSTGTNDAQAERNDRAASLLWRVSALAVAVDAVADETFEAYDDAILVRDQLVELLAEDEARDDVEGDFFDSVVDLRLGVFADLTERALQLPEIVEYTPAGVTSAVELAQLLYQDGSRADEIVERNGIAHPAFIAPQPLKVLAR